VKLTRNLKQVIVLQFKTGVSMQYMAELYGLRLLQVEEAIRERLVRQDEAAKEETCGR